MPIMKSTNESAMKAAFTTQKHLQLFAPFSTDINEKEKHCKNRLTNHRKNDTIFVYH